MGSRSGLAAVLLPALMVALVACGEKKDSGIATVNGKTGTAKPTATASLSEAQRQEQGRKFAQCMRDHGVQMSDPDLSQGGQGVALGGGQRGAADDKTKAALDACRRYLPNGGEPPKLDAKALEQARKFAQCMRAHGLPDFPDPDPNGGASVRGVDPNDPKFKTASEACKDLRPNGGGAVGSK
jgi:hypothetical protein